LIANRKYSAFGIGALNQRAYNQPINRTKLILPDDVNKGNSIVRIWNRNEHLLDSYYPTIQNNILSSVEYEYDESGSGACQIQFLQKSKIGFASFGIVTIDSQTRRYKGYINEFPDEGTNKNDMFVYKIKGLRERLKAITIEVKEKYNIQSITLDGVNTTYAFSESLTYNPIGRMLVAANCNNKLNNYNAIISSFTANSVTIYHPTGVNQSLPQGEIRILPYVWSVASRVSDIFKHAILTYASRFNNGIRYNSLKIEDSIGFTSQGWIDLDGLTFDKVLDGLRKMLAGAYILGVDEQGEYYFTKINSEPLDYFYIGYSAQNPEIKGKPGDIYNRITVFRKDSKTDTGKGLNVGAIAGPLADANTSAAKYGDRYKDINVPAFFSNEAAQLIADNALARYKDLKYTVAINNLSDDKEYPIGIYQVITPPVDRKLIISEHDTLDGWTIAPEITATINTTFVITGSGSTRYVVNTSANDKQAVFPCNIYLSKKKYLYLWVRSSQVGNLLDISITDGVSTFTNPVFFDLANNFNLVVWDIGTLTLTKITSVSYKFKNLTASTTIYVDELSVEIFGSIRYNVPLQKVKVKLSEHSTDVDLQFGEEFDKLADYLQGLQALSENSILAHRS
jgi:hypothetical protein